MDKHRERLYFVFTNKPPWPEHGTRVGAARVGPDRSVSIDCLPATVGKLTTISAPNKREAIRMSGFTTKD